MRQRRYADAEPLFRRSLAVLERSARRLGAFVVVGEGGR